MAELVNSSRTVAVAIETAQHTLHTPAAGIFTKPARVGLVVVLSSDYFTRSRFVAAKHGSIDAIFSSHFVEFLFRDLTFDSPVRILRGSSYLGHFETTHSGKN